MADHQKTTVYLDAADYRRLKKIAYQRDAAPAALIREAVAEYVTRREPQSLAAWIGSGNSGLGDIASRDEHYLAGMGEDGIARARTARPQRRARRR